LSGLFITRSIYKNNRINERYRDFSTIYARSGAFVDGEVPLAQRVPLLLPFSQLLVRINGFDLRKTKRLVGTCLRVNLK